MYKHAVLLTDFSKIDSYESADGEKGNISEWMNEHLKGNLQYLWSGHGNFIDYTGHGDYTTDTSEELCKVLNEYGVYFFELADDDILFKLTWT